jgi:hypothetical protein
MTVTKSSQNNLTSPNGNSLAVFVDIADSTLKLKDINGNVEDFTIYLPPTPLGDGILQLQNGAPLDSTLRSVTDQKNTASTLKLSTNSAQFVSPLRISTDDASEMYLDCEDGSQNNRFSITRNTASQQVNLNFASNPVGSTTIVGAIRTYQDGTNLLPTLSFIESGDIYQNKYSGTINNSYFQDNAGVNMPNGTGVYQGDYFGRRNGGTSTLFREAVTYNGDGTTRRGRYSIGVAEDSGFGAYQFVCTQYNNTKVNILGHAASFYIDDAVSPTTAYNIHAGNIINTRTGVLPLLSLDVNGLTKHVFQTNGNVSLNNTSDMSAILGIKGSGSTSATTSLLVQNSGATTSMIVRDDGNVGIGTTTPIGILHLKSTAATTRMVMDGDAGQSKIITYRTAGLQRFGLYVNNTAESGSNVGSDFAIRAYSDAGTLLNTPVFIKRSTGNVGINTLTGTAKLQVVGSGSTSATTSLLVQNSAGTELFKVNDNGESTFLSTTSSTPLSSNAAGSGTIAFELLSSTIRRFRILGTSALATLEASNTGGITTNAALNVGGSAAAQASAILQADSTTKGFLPPRMTTAEKVTLAATAVAGLMIYDTNLNKLCVYTGAGWETITSV